MSNRITRRTVCCFAFFAVFAALECSAEAQMLGRRFVSRAFHNSRLQQSYDQSHAHGLIARGTQAGMARHPYISQQAMSNAMQIGYGNAFSNNPHTRLSGIRALAHVAINRYASEHVRQTARNAYHQAMAADAKQTAFANHSHAFSALIRGGHTNIRVAPQYQQQFNQVKRASQPSYTPKQVGLIPTQSH